MYSMGFGFELVEQARARSFCLWQRVAVRSSFVLPPKMGNEAAHLYRREQSSDACAAIERGFGFELVFEFAFELELWFSALSGAGRPSRRHPVAFVKANEVFSAERHIEPVRKGPLVSRSVTSKTNRHAQRAKMSE